MIDKKDGGLASRKLWFAVGVCLALVGCWLLTGKSDALEGTYGELIGGLLGALAIFSGANVVHKMSVNKAASMMVGKIEEPADEEEAPAPPKAKKKAKVIPENEVD